MAVCGIRTLLLIVCVLEIIITIEKQVFDFLGYMWLSIIANFVNILLIIFGSFGAVQYITKYLVAYSIWSLTWCVWNIFLICYYLNIGTLNRESGLLSMGTGSVSWWESNGWGCQPVWGETDGADSWRPTKVEGCFFHWHHVELGQSVVAGVLTLLAMPLSVLSAYQSFKKRGPSSEKGTLPRRPIYTIELATAETNISENTLKPMTPRRVKRRSGSRSGSSRRSRRSYRNAGYLASNASLPRDAANARPTSAHSSYSNFHAARPASYHAPDRDNFEPPPPAPPSETVPVRTNTRYDSISRASSNPGYDVVGPYHDVNSSCGDPTANYDSSVRTYDKTRRDYETTSYNKRAEMAAPCESLPYGGAYGGSWELPPPPAPPYSARATPQAPGPPAYQMNDIYNNIANPTQSSALYQ